MLTLFQSHEAQELSLLFVRHAERVDAVMGKEWVKNCFEDSGGGSMCIYLSFVLFMVIQIH